jgi:hypothetical protein
METMMAEAARPDTEGVLWDGVRRIISAMLAFLMPDNPATGQDFAAATIATATSPEVARALAGQAGGIEAVAMRSIVDAVEGYLAGRLSQEELIGATISAVDTAPIAIALHGPAPGR